VKIVWYLLTVLLGAYGILALARTAERLVTGMPVLMVQVILGVVAILLAWRSLVKARELGQRGEGSVP